MLVEGRNGMDAKMCKGQILQREDRSEEEAAFKPSGAPS